jgi:hypothetical protein
MLYHSIEVVDLLNKELNSSDFYNSGANNRSTIMDTVVDKLNKKEDFIFAYIVQEISNRYAGDLNAGDLTTTASDRNHILPQINLTIISLRLNYYSDNYWYIIKNSRNEL